MICEFINCSEEFWSFWSDVANCVVAITAIIGTLALYLQLRSIAKQERLEHISQFAARYQNIFEKFPSDIGSEKFLQIKHSKSDTENVARQMRAYFDLCYEEWDLATNRKLIDRKDWDELKGGIKKTIQKAAFSDAWKQLGGPDSEFGEDFKKFIKELHS